MAEEGEGGDFQDASDSVMPVGRCYARFEVLTAVLLNIQVFWDIMLWWPKVNS
jgi:hypothetical protein